MKKTALLMIAAVGRIGMPAEIVTKPPAPMIKSIPTVQGKLFAVLSKVENCAKWRNPGCLTYASQPGAERGPGGYAVFLTLLQGQDALRKRIARDAGRTVRQFLQGFNPGWPKYPGMVAGMAGLSLEEVL